MQPSGVVALCFVVAVFAFFAGSIHMEHVMTRDKDYGRCPWRCGCRLPRTALVTPNNQRPVPERCEGCNRWIVADSCTNPVWRRVFDPLEQKEPEHAHT